MSFKHHKLAIAIVAITASEAFAAPVIIVRPPVMVARPYVAPARPAPTAKPIEKQVTPTPMPVIVAPMHTGCNDEKRKEKRC
jgi:hypothetical protein